MRDIAAQEGERLQIVLERTACFGLCPDYIVTLDADGTVHYNGRQFVRVRGAQTWKIDAAAVYALAREMETAGFFTWKDTYTATITDQPTTFTTLTIGARTKRIKDYYGAPQALKDIERRIDEVSGANRYVRGDKGKLDEALARGDAAAVKALLASGVDARAREALSELGLNPLMVEAFRDRASQT